MHLVIIVFGIRNMIILLLILEQVLKMHKEKISLQKPILKEKDGMSEA